MSTILDEDDNFEFREVADPKSFPFLHSLEISEEVKSRLSILLSKVVKGSSEVYLSGIGKSHNPESVLKGWDKIFNSQIDNNDKILIKFELSNRGKFGPRSLCLPWKDRRISLKQYFDRGTHKFEIDSSKFPSSNLRPISISEATKKLKPNTSSGLPYLIKKKLCIEKSVDNLDFIDDQAYPCVLYTRTQEQGKTRNVWGYPLVDTLKEMMFYIPLLSYQKKLSWRTSLHGPEKVDQSVSNILSKLLSSDGYVLISIDFSSYDATISYELQKLCFEYIKGLFQTKHHDTLDQIFERFSSIGIVTPDGIISGIHGVPSGATLTNEVDSIAQYLVAETAIKYTIGYEVQGDDGLICIRSDKVEYLIDLFKQSGLNVNVDKSYTSKDYCIFLQKLYETSKLNKGFVGGVYSTYRALNRIIYQERYYDFADYDMSGVDYYSLRTITILENVKYHPLFEDLVKYIYSIDKYKLKYSKGAVDKYRDYLLKGQGIGGVITNQYGDEISGLENFETVKILRRLWNNDLA